jgi:hypothetical protein
MLAFMGAAMPTDAAAGWMDKINQVTSKINQTSQQVDNVNRAKQQVESLGSKLPKPSAKNKSAADQESEDAAEFELTKTKNPIKGEWGDQVTCAGPNTATCQNGMVNLVNCMHQAKGYWYRLVAANLQGRLDTDPDLADEDRAMLEEDIASLNEAVKTDKVVDPDPEYPQRYMAWLTEEDQQDIQKMNSKYMNEVRNDCDNRFGGMARYSK